MWPLSHTISTSIRDKDKCYGLKRGSVMSAGDYTPISGDPALRDHIRSLKRGQESYSEVLERLCEAAGETPPDRN